MDNEEDPEQPFSSAQKLDFSDKSPFMKRFHNDIDEEENVQISEFTIFSDNNQQKEEKVSAR